MAVLDGAEHSILDQIISSNGAWVSLVNLQPPEAISTLLDQGLITLWCKDSGGHILQDGPFVTLTPFGATVRHVVLMERVEGYPRWVDVKRAERRDRNRLPLRARSWVGCRLMAFPELVAALDERESYMMDDMGRTIYLFDNVPIAIDPRLTKCRRTNKKAPGSKSGAFIS